MKLFKQFAAITAACLFFVSCAPSSGRSLISNDFKLKDLDGKTVALSDFRGKVVFIDFFATWCPPCRQSIPAVESLYNKYKDNPNVVFLGINVGEDEQKVKDFVKESGITYKVLLGDKNVMASYKIRSIPSFFVIDARGNISNKHVGYMPGLEAQWDQDIKILLKK